MVYAVDVTDGLLQDPRRPDNFRFVPTNGVAIPVAPATVDLAYSNQVLEHLHPEDACDHLRGVHAALRFGRPVHLRHAESAIRARGTSRGTSTAPLRGLHLKEYTIVGAGRPLTRVRLRRRVSSQPVTDIVCIRRRRRSFQSAGSSACSTGLPRRVSRVGAAGLAVVKIVATRRE